LFFGVPMSLRRVGGLVAIALAAIFWMSCGEVYRPVVIPIAITPPNSQNFHAVYAVSTNQRANPGAAFQIDVSGDTNIGQADMGINPTHAAILPNNSVVFVASAGSLFFGESDIITAFTPARDSLSPTGLGNPTIITLPNVPPNQTSGITTITEAGNVVTVTVSAPFLNAQVGGTIVITGVLIPGQNIPNPNAYDGTFTISAVSGNTVQYVNTIAGLPALGAGGTATLPVPLFCSYLPDFITTTQNNAVYIANYGAEGTPTCNIGTTDSVAIVTPQNAAVSRIVYLPGGSHPIAMVETPDIQNLYVLNQGTDSVTDLSPIDLSTMKTIQFPVGSAPVWAVSRSDSHRIYILNQGSGMLVPIDTATNTILPSQTNLSVGVGANFILYDPVLNRLYVTNPSNGTLYIFSITGGVDLGGNPNDTPTLLATIPMTAGLNPPCSSACSPVSVTTLPDTSRFYVASYELEGPSQGTTCPDPNVGPASDCLIPRLTVFDALSMTVKPIPSKYSLLSPSLSLLSSSQYSSQFSSSQYALPVVPSCAPAAAYAPGTTRFRMFTTAAADGSHVYVSMCDAGYVADINTVTTSITSNPNNSIDTLVYDLTAPFSVCSANCSPVAQITSFSITSNVATFQALNTFTPGTRVQVSNLSSPAGAQINGQTLTVLGAGLSGTQFECNVSQGNVGATTDNGTAVPLPPLQAPIFLLAGQ
jgi:hypothetical protein